MPPHTYVDREISGQQPTQLYKVHNIGQSKKKRPPCGLDVASGKGDITPPKKNSLENESLNLLVILYHPLSMIFANFVMPWIGLWLSIFESQVLPTIFVS